MIRLLRENNLIYNYYNLDPDRHKTDDVQRDLLIEPSVLQKHVVSEKCMDFTICLLLNITEIKLFTIGFIEVTELNSAVKVTFKEHPLNQLYRGK